LLPTFIITLREGLEASLIVGIIAAFLSQEGRRDALRPMWGGVVLAVVLCLGVGAALRVVGEQLPHKAQEGMEAVIGLVAVAMITYMVVWMRRHSRGLKGQLQGEVAGALARGSTLALVGMAFLAVLREGFETAVFLLAAFQDADDTTAAGAGAVVGLLVAVGLGYALYRGGVKLNLSRFFRITGAVLVIVAAGLVASALHAAAEAGWVASGSEVLDLTWLVAPGTVSASLLTGMLGLQPEPTALELAGWLLYAIPMLVFVAAPDRIHGTLRSASAGFAVVAAPATLLVGVLAGSSRAGTTTAASLSGGARTVQVAVSDAGCEPASLRLPSGPATFEVASSGTKVTEFEVLRDGRTVAEAENLSAGIGGRLSLTLQPGRYELACPGGTTTPRGTLVVTGARAAAAQSATVRAGVRRYRAYLERQTDALVSRVDRFAAALTAGNAAEARRLFAWAREPYERVEPVAESFGDLDPSIDARVNDVEEGQPWTGFHAIERRLWVDRTTAGTAPLARKLVRDVRRLRELTRTVDLEPAQIGNGATALLGEVSKSKVTGEEDRYSHTDLTDFKANVDGARAAFDAIRPVLASRDVALARLIDSRFGLVDAALSRHRRGAAFVPYDELDRRHVRRLSEVVDALAEPLSQAPAKALSS
jgi:FTR1 family protein